jgi:nitrogen fixation protein FixH
VPEGATRVVQVASRQVVRGARARTRIVRDCVITTRAGERTYRCELRLPAGRWSVSTEARKGSTVLAKSVRRVTLATPKPVAVKPEAVTG